MHTHISGVFAAIIVGLAAMVTPHSPLVSQATETRNETPCPEKGGSKSALLHCLVFQVDDAQLVAQLEAAAGGAPEKVAAAAALLQGSEKAHRLARIHVPVQDGREVTYQNARQVPTVQINQGQFTKQTSFSGFQKASTHLNFKCHRVADSYDTRFSIRIESFLSSGKGSRRDSPPPRDQVSLNGSVSAPSGVTRMYQLDAGSKNSSTLVVFVTASAL